LVTLDQMGDLGPEQLLDALDRGERVLDHVVEQARNDRGRVEAEVGEEVGHLEGMDQVRLPRLPDLALVGEGREDVRPPEQPMSLSGMPGPAHQVRIGSWRSAGERRDRLGFIIGRVTGVKAASAARAASCVSSARRLVAPLPLFRSLYWPGRMILACGRGRPTVSVGILRSGLIPTRPPRAA
jgi:hypothetical protein